MSEPEKTTPTGASVRDRHYSERRIRRIARHMAAQSYLEIGVSRGLTFNRVFFNKKVGVDPHFRFEVSDYRSETVEFHSLTSDQYFMQSGGSAKFDVIFLDGLHRFQQTFRDFCNSLVCSHDRTVWLIDDVIPVDVYSSWPNQREAKEFRKRGGAGTSGEWHGDVFKLVFALHDFFPTLSYVTLIGSGNPQTIVWKTPRTEFRPIFNSLEAIERLGYFDMLQRDQIFNAREEEDAFCLFFASMPRQSNGPQASVSVTSADH